MHAFGNEKSTERGAQDDQYFGRLPEQSQNAAMPDVAASHAAQYDRYPYEIQHVDLTLKTN
jgi:hypothetical protein